MSTSVFFYRLAIIVAWAIFNVIIAVCGAYWWPTWTSVAGLLSGGFSAMVAIELWERI